MGNRMRKNPLKVHDIIKDAEIFRKAIATQDYFTTRGGIFKGATLKPNIDRIIVEVFHKKTDTTIYHITSPVSFRSMIEKMGIK